MAQNDRILGLLGLANRAHKLSLGMTATQKAIARGHCRLLILATDIARNAEEKVGSEAKRHNVPVTSGGSKDDFGRIFGRREVAIIGVNDSGFAKSLSGLLDRSEENLPTEERDPQ